jgi:putative transposon-encoded protein
MKVPSQITLQGEEMIEKVVKGAGSSGRVFVPKAWIGRHVAIILLPENGKK